MEVDSSSGGQMSMAKLPSNTLTTSTTVKQMASVQPPQLLAVATSASASASETSVAINAESVETEEENGEPFDILSAALSASLTTEPEQMQKSQAQQSFVLTTLPLMEGVSNPAAIEASGSLTIAPPPPPPPSNPLAASVNEIAQISALTAAISPIQALPTGAPPPPPSRLAKPLLMSVAGEVVSSASSTLLVLNRSESPLPVSSSEESSPEKLTTPIEVGPSQVEDHPIPLVEVLEGSSETEKSSGVEETSNEILIEDSISTQQSTSPDKSDLNLPEAASSEVDETMVEELSRDNTTLKDPSPMAYEFSQQEGEQEQEAHTNLVESNLSSPQEARLVESSEDSAHSKENINSGVELVEKEKATSDEEPVHHAIDDGITVAPSKSSPTADRREQSVAEHSTSPDACCSPPPEEMEIEISQDTEIIKESSEFTENRLEKASVPTATWLDAVSGNSNSEVHESSTNIEAPLEESGVDDARVESVSSPTPGIPEADETAEPNSDTPEVVAAFAPMEMAACRDESNEAMAEESSLERSPYLGSKLVDYDCTESSENDTTNQSKVSIDNNTASDSSNTALPSTDVTTGDDGYDVD